MTRCKHDLDPAVCADCNPRVKAKADELDRLTRTAVASRGYKDLRGEDR